MWNGHSTSFDDRRASPSLSAMADVTSLSIRDRERLLASAVRAQAGRVLAARRTLELTNEALTAARRTRDLLDRRVTEGGSTKLDANLAAVEAMRLEADAALAAGDLEAATIELRALVGLAPDAPLTLSDSLESLARRPTVPRLTAIAAIETRPDLREAIARIQLADARVEQARRDARSEVSVVGGWTRNQLDVSAAWDSTNGHARARSKIRFTPYVVGAKVTLPFSNRNQGALASVQAERQGAEAAVYRAAAGRPSRDRRGSRAGTRGAPGGGDLFDDRARARTAECGRDARSLRPWPIPSVGRADRAAALPRGRRRVYGQSCFAPTRRARPSRARSEKPGDQNHRVACRGRQSRSRRRPYRRRCGNRL